MAGFFLPKLASKIKPSTAINRNWENVTMFPHPGNCLQAWKIKTSVRTTPWRTNIALGSNEKMLTAHNPRVSISLEGLYRFICAVLTLLLLNTSLQVFIHLYL